MSWVPYPWAAKFEKMMKDEGVDFLPPDEKEVPVLIRDLLGRPARLIKSNELVTMDYVPSRVNIEIDSEGKILRISFG